MSHPPGPPAPYGHPAPSSAPTESKATTALILGLVSLFLCGFFTGVPAIVIGLSARKSIRQSNGALGGDGLALGGIVAGALGTLWMVVGLVLLVGLYLVGAEVVRDYQDL